VGTVLRVFVDADGRASVAVGHGAVEVRPLSGPPHMVRAGEAWPAGLKNMPDAKELEELGERELEGTTLESFASEAAAAAPRPADCPSAPEAAFECLLGRAEGGDGAQAEAALYQAGWIALRDLHHPARALEIWGQERHRFEKGALLPDAWASSIDALVALHRGADAEREIAGFVRAFPTSARIPEMYFVRGTIALELDGSCRRALPYLDLALRHPAAPWEGRAKAARHQCQGTPRAR
jgi:hypothetical protein